MDQQARYFVRMFEKASGGDFVLAETIELPNEETANYVAKTGSLDRAGTAALAIGTDERNCAVLLRTYGFLPSKSVILSGF